MSQPVFIHLELASRSVPKTGWSVAGTSIHGSGVQIFYEKEKCRKVLTLDANANKLEETFFDESEKRFAKITYSDLNFTEEFFDANGAIYYRKRVVETDVEKTEEWEVWFDERGYPMARRHTIGGELEDDGEKPAVSINRRDNLRREEYWDSNILNTVLIVDQRTGATLVKQIWEAGVCKSQVVDTGRIHEVEPRDLAMPLSKSIDPSKKTYNVTPVQEARKEFESQKDEIQKILEKFEAQRKTESYRGVRIVHLRMDTRLHLKVAEILREAGYSASFRDSDFWVEY